jgi:polyhydroxyalkanoate synthesis regulator phasin
MWKKVLALSAGILAVVLLITGIMTAVNADNTGSTATEPAAGMPPGPPPDRGPGTGFNNDILAKVAAKLNIDKAALEDAFKQVMLEEQQARTDEMFAAWVKDGKLTQEQADAYKAWLSAKPADMPGFPFFAGAKTDMLDKLLKDGKITQSQYDAYKAWIAQKPAVELPRPERPAGGPPCLKNGDPK